MARDKIVWVAKEMPTLAHGTRTVYVKHYSVPFVGLMAAADTAFSVPAFIVVKGKRVTGYVTPDDGMAFQQEHGALIFRHHTKELNPPLRGQMTDKSTTVVEELKRRLGNKEDQLQAYIKGCEDIDDEVVKHARTAALGRVAQINQVAFWIDEIVRDALAKAEASSQTPDEGWNERSARAARLRQTAKQIIVGLNAAMVLAGCVYLPDDATPARERRSGAAESPSCRGETRSKHDSRKRHRRHDGSD